MTLEMLDVPDGLGYRLKTRREAMGLSQTELGKRAGVHQLLIRSLEMGDQSLVVASHLERIASVLRVSPWALLGKERM